jgi:hypothetical protein
MLKKLAVAAACIASATAFTGEARARPPRCSANCARAQLRARVHRLMCSRSPPRASTVAAARLSQRGLRKGRGGGGGPGGVPRGPSRNGRQGGHGMLPTRGPISARPRPCAPPWAPPCCVQQALKCGVAVLTARAALAAPVGITRASGVLAKADAFATKRALPTAAPVERANALDSLQVNESAAQTQVQVQDALTCRRGVQPAWAQIWQSGSSGCALLRGRRNARACGVGLRKAAGCRRRRP